MLHFEYKTQNALVSRLKDKAPNFLERVSERAGKCVARRMNDYTRELTIEQAKE
jgi:hypothetical protein